ncbi:transcriptional repressor LexA [Aureliella helgolandensis]|uniref:LexA repressor n=1 Tax=Aureliella helgolandensis TaxID=2527968 RepID=A0A518GGB0_9BACT|nr:transcriptional repressor LexA [Aureliella helgolandensis]QDV27588.1 LexA repressor [Aureliella helgolandensis]
MNRPLTKQQQVVYDFIRERIIARGYGPTVREIGEHMNIKSPNGVMCHLKAIERKGMIVRTANKSRAIELTEPISRLFGASLTVSGNVHDSVYFPVPAEQGKTVDLSIMARDGRCLLKVLDDSLQEVHICSGDYLIMQLRETPASGQLVMVQISETENALRYWFPEHGRTRLQPVNRLQPALLVDQAEVLGVVVGVVRSVDNLLF